MDRPCLLVIIYAFDKFLEALGDRVRRRSVGDEIYLSDNCLIYHSNPEGSCDVLGVGVFPNPCKISTSIFLPRLSFVKSNGARRLRLWTERSASTGGA